MTGANSGLGYQVAETLSRLGATVVLACRNEERAWAAASRIKSALDKPKLRVCRLDLADLTSVDGCVAELRKDLNRIDLLVNNAGLYGVPARRTTAQGFELHLGTNHLGHFALTGRLLPLLRRSSAARVVTVTSLVHRFARIDFEDLQQQRRYGRHRAYAQSKLANLLFAVELNRRLRAAGSPIRSLAAHPGMTTTNLVVNGPFVASARPLTRAIDRAIVKVNPYVHQPVAAGAQALMIAAVADAAEGGEYYGPSGPLGIRGRPARVKPSSRSYDPIVARRLWEESEALTGVSYDFSASS